MNHPELSGSGGVENHPGEEALNPDQIKKIARLQELTARRITPDEQARLLADTELIGVAREFAIRGLASLSNEEAKRIWLGYEDGEGKMRSLENGEIPERVGIVNDLALSIDQNPEKIAAVLEAIERDATYNPGESEDK